MPQEAVIVSGARTAVGRAKKGTLATCRPEDMARAAIHAAWQRAGDLDPALAEDLILGCAFPEAEQGMNLGRIAAMKAGRPVEVPGQTINRFCSSGLQAIALAVDAVVAGRAEVVVAGGTESMSLIPMGGHKIAPNQSLIEH